VCSVDVCRTLDVKSGIVKLRIFLVAVFSYNNNPN